MRTQPPGPKPTSKLVIQEKLQEKPERTQVDIARELGISRQRVNQVSRKIFSWPIDNSPVGCYTNQNVRFVVLPQNRGLGN